MGIHEDIEDLRKRTDALKAEYERPKIRRLALMYLDTIGFSDHADKLATLQANTWSETKAAIDKHFSSAEFRILKAMRRRKVPSITSSEKE